VAVAQFQDAKARCTPRAGFALGKLDNVWPILNAAPD
jgi:hypothetical protein